jgi:hypothetical protein
MLAQKLFNEAVWSAEITQREMKREEDTKWEKTREDVANIFTWRDWGTPWQTWLLGDVSRNVCQNCQLLR